MLFDVGSHMDRLDIFKIPKPALWHQSRNWPIALRHPGILVADRNSEALENRLAASGPTSAMIAGIWNGSAS